MESKETLNDSKESDVEYQVEKYSIKSSSLASA